MTIIGKKLK